MKKQLYKIIIAMVLFGLVLIMKNGNLIIRELILLTSYLLVGMEVLRKAVRNLFNGKIFDENFLMALATVGAFAIREYPEAVAVMLFYQIGELLQDFAVDKSKESISDLMNIRPDYANVVRNGKQEKVNPNSVKIGEIIIIKPGEKIPLDATIIEGKTTLDTKALTGESIPKDVVEGNQILSGCINLTGVIKAEVTKEFGESTVSKILDLVENASNKKSKSENFITKFAKYYTPIVVILAVMLAIVPPLVIKDAKLFQWIYRALSFLVVSCPCALVISIPLSFFGGIGVAAKKGILVKGSNYIEILSKTETVVFDKTGTLTKGIFDVQKIEPVKISKNELLEVAAYAENYSNHPISQSLKKAYNQKIDEKKIIKVEEMVGRGIFAKIEKNEVLVGNEKLMNEKQIKYTKCTECGTILYIAINNEYAGYILISDTEKEDSLQTVKDLKANSIKQIIMLTGDKKEVGESVAKKIGIDKVYAELLPDGKVNKVEELLKENSKGGKLAFVGDGINDAPVLAMADLGIAMGGVGADSAIEAADVVIMTDEPSKIVDAIKLSKKTMRIVKENIVLAIGVKIGVLVLSAVGISNMWSAVFADVGVTVIATLNSTRMLFGYTVKKFLKRNKKENI